MGEEGPMPCQVRQGLPHGGHYGRKRRNRMSVVQTHAQTHPIEEPDEHKEHQAGAHKATKRSTAAARRTHNHGGPRCWS